MAEKDTMLYRNLGNSGLKVSALSIGNWVNAESLSAQEAQTQIFSKFIDAGVNYLDTAEMYGAGNGEIMLGNILKNGGWDREDLIISTKFIKCGKSLGLSRKRLVQSMRNSLKRLQLDYVDIMYLHRFDGSTPLEESIRAVSHLIEKGKASYWGTSEFTDLQLMEVYKICEKFGYDYPIAEQCQYNMLVRENVEVNYTQFFEKYGLGTAVWSPLFNGILSGKYNNGNFPEGSRLTKLSNRSASLRDSLLGRFSEENKEKTIKMLNGLKGIADQLGISQSQLALAWCIKNPDVCTAITGATSLNQAGDNVLAVEAVSKLNGGVLELIEEVVGSRPKQWMDPKTHEPRKDRR